MERLNGMRSQHTETQQQPSLIVINHAQRGVVCVRGSRASETTTRKVWNSGEPGPCVNLVLPHVACERRGDERDEPRLARQHSIRPEHCCPGRNISEDAGRRRRVDAATRRTPMQAEPSPRMGRRLAELTVDSSRQKTRSDRNGYRNTHTLLGERVDLTRTDSCSSRYRPSDVRDPKRQGFGPAMCVRHVDVRVICILHNDAQFAAFFVDPRAK